MTSSLDVADGDDPRTLLVGACPSCQRVVIEYVRIEYDSPSNAALVRALVMSMPQLKRVDRQLVWPRFRAMPSVSEHAPEPIAKTILEAHRVLDVSTTASAALGRRAIQAILRDKGYQKATLYQEIEAAANDLPPYIGKDLLHTMREIGNLAAHLTMSHTGDVVDATEDEAAWCLHVVSELVDHFYVRPAQSAARKVAFDAKKATYSKKP